MDRKAMQHEFLMLFIFNPKEIWLPDAYKPIVKELNVWGRNVITNAQKDRLLEKREFKMRGAIWHTGPDIKELKAE